MPYIEQAKRLPATPTTSPIEDTGELNYRLTRVIMRYMNDKGTSYGTINDIVGALEGAKLEFYRRVAVPYEDFKCQLNGDVYE
jgi:hypothetical protein